MQRIEQSIFRNGSTTYYWSSRFFPVAVRDDVFRLYSFVRIADEYVDSLPPKRARFKALRKAWELAYVETHFDTDASPADTINERVVKNMVHVYRTYGFDIDWITAFLDVMQADLDGRQYKSIEDTLWYVHGSAEVIGLMMAKILNLSPEAYEGARMQGRAMQFINFIRDVDEDIALGRCYFPQDELTQFGLPDLTRETAHAQHVAFKKFMRFQIERYQAWQDIANLSLKHIPRRPRIAIATAVDMYNWTGRVIHANPHVVFDRKVKPEAYRVLRTGLAKVVTI